jgi:hypothetical protein
MLMDIEKEKRNSERLKLEFDVKYKNLMPDGLKNYRLFNDSKTKDISKRGACIRTRSMIEENSVLNAKMRIGKKTIRAFCEVKWSGVNEKTGSYEAGLNYIMFNEDDISYLEDYIKGYGERGQALA